MRTTLVVMILTLMGCSGMEVGGKAGIYRVDERQESQRTYRRAIPLRCYFTTCTEQAEEAQGS